MADEKRVRALKQKRTSLKAQITGLRKFSDGHNVDLINLKLRFDRVKELFKNFTEFQDELMILDSDGGHEDEFESMNDNYFAVAAQVERLITVDPETASVSGQSNRSESSASIAPKRKIKLPEISMPRFSGKYTEWLSFKDKFEALVHNQSDLDVTEKMQYLDDALSGEAKDKITILSLSGKDYNEAWEHLNECYHNERLIISNHLSDLLNLPPVEKDKVVEGLTKLADHTRMHMKALKKFDISVTPQIVVKILESKLPHFLSNKWDEVVNSNKFPELDDLITFIRRWAATLSIRPGQNSKSSKDSNPLKKGHAQGQNRNTSHPEKRSRQSDSNTRALVTTASKRPEIKCLMCERQHHFSKCRDFLELSEKLRYKKVKELQLCLNCLKKNHQANECRNDPCKKCSKKHNILLHFENTKDSQS